MPACEVWEACVMFVLSPVFELCEILDGITQLNLYTSHVLNSRQDYNISFNINHSIENNLSKITLYVRL